MHIIFKHKMLLWVSCVYYNYSCKKYGAVAVDYVHGRIDLILNWAEIQTSEIAHVPNQGVGQLPMFDQIPVEPKDV